MGTKIYTNGKWIDLIGRATRNQYAYKQLYLDTNFIWDMPNVTGVDPLDRKICYFTDTPQRSIDGTGAIIPLLTATEFDTQGVSFVVINIANISSLSTYLEGLYARVVLNGTVSPIYTLSSKLIALGGEEISDSDNTLEELAEADQDGILEEIPEESSTITPIDDNDSSEILETRSSSTPIVPVYNADIPQEDMVMSDNIQQGDVVTHAKYGSGVVEKMIKYGNKTLFSINFDNIGRRLLDPTLTEIKKA